MTAPSVDPAGVPADAAVLDVREDGEWSAGHIPGSTHVPMSTLQRRLDEVPGGDAVVVVCRVGSRSGQVAAWLRGQGYPAVNLDGGLLAWEDAGRELVRDDGGPAQIV